MRRTESSFQPAYWDQAESAEGGIVILSLIWFELGIIGFSTSVGTGGAAEKSPGTGIEK